jgi:hypothetical protein
MSMITIKETEEDAMSVRSRGQRSRITKRSYSEESLRDHIKLSKEIIESTTKKSKRISR